MAPYSSSFTGNSYMLSALKQHLWKAGLRNTAVWKTAKILYRDRNKRRYLRQLARENRGERAQLRILVINHFFDGEIEALGRCLEGRDDVSILSIRPEPFFSRAMTWFPESVHWAGLEYDSPELEPVRKRYRDYCRQLLRELSTHFPFDCLLTPSDSFYWLREFIHTCQEGNILVIVADKEGTISPRSFAVEPLRIRRMFPPIADYFFVWSERQQSFWLKAGVDSSRICVVGSMRTDIFVQQPRQHPSSILFFDFDTDAYINNMDWEALQWKGERNWDYLRDAIHRVLLHTALQNPHLTVTIKCHPQQLDTHFPAALLAQPNVKIIKGAPSGLPALIADAIAVVGFQTTALLEAALERKPVFYTAWGDLFALVLPEVLPWSEPGFGLTWIRSEAQLEEALGEILRQHPEPVQYSADYSRIGEYFHQPDGKVTERLLCELNRIAGRKGDGILA